MRADQGQAEFVKWLLLLGNGQAPCNEEDTPPDSVSIPQQCHVTDSTANDVFPVVSNSRELIDTVILTPKNDAALQLNDAVLKKLPGDTQTYLSTDKAVCDEPSEAANYPIEFLNSLTPSGMPPHRLILKPNSIVILLRNLDVQRGLCNGTRLMVV